jgi:hypothetical protein
MALASAPSRQPMLRLTASKGLSRPVARVEQGDTSRGQVLRLPARAAAAPHRPEAPKPARAARHRQP